jgi:outer membrane protein TolC
MALARYQAQVGTNTDVLDAQANVSSSEAQLIQALADYQNALSTLFIAMGEKNAGLVTE